MDNRNGVQTEIIDSSAVGLGGNQFETSAINVPANGKIAKGAVLKRSGNDFALLTDAVTEVPVAVNPFDIENKGAAAASMSLRAIVFGPVRGDLLTINGQPITTAQGDTLRDRAMIIPVKIHDISAI